MSYTVQVDEYLGHVTIANENVYVVIQDVHSQQEFRESFKKGNESSLLRVAAALQAYIDEQNK